MSETFLNKAQLSGLSKDARRTEILRAKGIAELDARATAVENLGVKGYDYLSGPIGPITSVTDSGLEVTWMAEADRLYKISLFYNAYAFSVSNVGNAAICNQSNVVQIDVTTPPLSNSVGTAVSGFVLQSGLSGTTTRKVRYSQAVGSGGVYMATGSTLLIEDVGLA